MTGRALPGVFKRSDPLAPCDKVGDRYKHECFINHSGWLMNGCAQATSARNERYAWRTKGKFRSACLQSIGLMVTNPVWQAQLSRNAGQEVAERRSPGSSAPASRPRAAQTVWSPASTTSRTSTSSKADRQKAFCADVTGRAPRTRATERIGVNLLSRTKDERHACARAARLSVRRRRPLPARSRGSRMIVQGRPAPRRLRARSSAAEGTATATPRAEATTS